MIKTTIVSYGEVPTKSVTTYVERLDAHLDSYYPSISWHVFDEGMKGSTAQLLLEHIEEKVFVHHPNIVFINLSSQDMKVRATKHILPEVYGEIFEKLLDKIYKHNNRTGLNDCRPIPIIITPPPMPKDLETHQINNDMLESYTQAVGTVVEEYNGVFINILQGMLKKFNYENMLDIHGHGLNQIGHDFLYDTVFIELTKLMNYQGVLRTREPFKVKI